MRILNIFLVLNIVICYGGLCGNTAYSAAQSNIAQESCHKMDHDNTRTGNDNDLINNKQDTYDSNCCFNSLLNSAPREYSKADFTHTHLLPITNPYLEKYESLRSSQDPLFREHDPPDLQTSYSTFLL